MEINISPEEIDTYVKKAIIESSIGKIINDSATKYMNDVMNNTYNSPVKDIIQRVAKEMIEAILNRPENKTIIEKAVQDKFTDEHVRNVIYSVSDKLSR